MQWLHTGQHGDMARQILACFDIVPDITLQREGSSLSEFSVGCRRQLDQVVAREPWSAVIVQGDTESAFLGALAAFYAASRWRTSKPAFGPTTSIGRSRKRACAR